MDLSSDVKSARVLTIYSKLVSGEVLKKSELEHMFHVTARTIQRDIESLRCFFSEQMLMQDIVYDTKQKGYRLTNTLPQHLTNDEILAICKILLEAVHSVGPHTISVPRVKHADDIDPGAFDNGISDDTFAKICALIRIAVPYTGMIISTREGQAVRERVLPLGVSQSAAAPVLPSADTRRKSVRQTRSSLTCPTRERWTKWSAGLWNWAIFRPSARPVIGRGVPVTGL